MRMGPKSKDWHPCYNFSSLNLCQSTYHGGTQIPLDLLLRSQGLEEGNTCMASLIREGRRSETQRSPCGDTSREGAVGPRAQRH